MPYWSLGASRGTLGSQGLPRCATGAPPIPLCAASTNWGPPVWPNGGPCWIGHIGHMGFPVPLFAWGPHTPISMAQMTAFAKLGDNLPKCRL